MNDKHVDEIINFVLDAVAVIVKFRNRAFLCAGVSMFQHLRKPAVSVVVDACEQFCFHLDKKSHHQGKIAVGRICFLQQEGKMTLYVGYLELLVIGIGLVEIVDDDRCLERLHDLFGEEVGKEIGLDFLI